uniref:Uncharacterized protein n=1 Tax=Steinernema glaseri TaxID=37863 RepID=A0A1I7YEX4_9BILA
MNSQMLACRSELPLGVPIPQTVILRGAMKGVLATNCSGGRTRRRFIFLHDVFQASILCHRYSCCIICFRSLRTPTVIFASCQFFLLDFYAHRPVLIFAPLFVIQREARSSLHPGIRKSKLLSQLKSVRPERDLPSLRPPKDASLRPRPSSRPRPLHIFLNDQLRELYQCINLFLIRRFDLGRPPCQFWPTPS